MPSAQDEILRLLRRAQNDIPDERPLNTPIGFEPKGNPSVLLPAQVHDETVAVGYRVGIPLKAL